MKPGSGKNLLKKEEQSKIKTNVLAILKKPWSERSIDEKRTVYGVFNGSDPEFKSRNGKLTKLEKKEPKPITTLVMEELKEPRPTFILIKGDFTRPAQKLTLELQQFCTSWMEAKNWPN